MVYSSVQLVPATYTGLIIYRSESMLNKFKAIGERDLSSSLSPEVFGLDDVCLMIGYEDLLYYY